MTLILSGTDGLSDVDGSAATPAIRGTDANTGIFFPAADTIAFSEGGVESMRIDSSGNLGIGTSSPSSFNASGLPLVVGSGSGNTGMTIYSGTAASGSIHFADGTTTTDSYRGIVAYSHTSNYMTLWTDATERMRIDSSGNVGLGVTPAAWALSGAPALQIKNAGFAGYLNNAYVSANQYFTVSGNSAYIANGFATVYTQTTGQHQWSVAASGTAGNTISFTQAMTLDASGNLGVGSTSPSTYSLASNLVVETATSGGLTIRSGVNGYGGVFFADGTTGTDQYRGFIQYNHGFSSPNDAMIFGTSGSNRVYIDSSGNLLVGTQESSATAGAGVKIFPSSSNAVGIGIVNAATTNSDLAYRLYSTGAAAYRFYVGYAGTVFATNTTISAISDIRYKENIRDLDVGLDKIMALKPRLYDWKEGKGVDIKNARGFIAQEFEEVFPDLIDEWQDPAPEGEEPYKSVRQDLIPVLVKAIQEQQALITQLQADVAALKGASA